MEKKSESPVQAVLSHARLNFELKGQLFTSLIETVREEGRWAPVAAMLSPATRALVETPPLSSAWMPALPLTELHCVLFELFGEQACRRFSKRSIERGSARTTRSITNGLVRLFGATPPTFFSRLPMFATMSSKGLEYVWKLDSSNAGQLEVIYASSSDIPPAVWAFNAGGLELIFDVTGNKGTIAYTAPTVAPRNRTVFYVRW